MNHGKATTKKREAKKSVTVGVRCHRPLLAMLDDYRRSEPDIPTRASALRRLAIIGLRDKSRLTTSFRGAGFNRRQHGDEAITSDEAQWIAANIVKLPGLLRR